MNKYVIIAVVILGIGMGIWSYKFHSSPRPELSAPGSADSGLPTGSTANGPAAANSPAVNATPPPSTAGVNPEFVEYIRTEARLIDSAKNSPAKAENRGDAKASTMGPTEIAYAKQLVLATAAPANERILAAYLLTEAKQKSWSALQDIILSQVPQMPAGTDPHSVAETKNMQEKALRIMAVDGLAEQAIKDGAARELLSKLASEATDSVLREYILDKIQDLPPLE